MHMSSRKVSYRLPRNIQCYIWQSDNLVNVSFLKGKLFVGIITQIYRRPSMYLKALTYCRALACVLQSFLCLKTLTTVISITSTEVETSRIACCGIANQDYLLTLLGIWIQMTISLSTEKRRLYGTCATIVCLAIDVLIHTIRLHSFLLSS